nr:tyrosine-type recombinase/integrase [Dendrosporobacter quercicolus]
MLCHTRTTRTRNNRKRPLEDRLSPSSRHMAATYLITSGTDIRTVAGKLGHANTNTTTIVYTHLLKSAEKETADKMGDFLRLAVEKEKEKQKKQAR